MATYDFTPVTMLELERGEKIRAYVHPVRMTILEMLAKEKQSVSGAARALGVPPANLTHHFKLLEKAGLIKLVEKRDTGKNLEKFYRAVAYHFTIARTGEPPENKNALTLSILHDHLTAALQSVRSAPEEQPVFGLLKTLRLTPEEAAGLHRKLGKILEEYSARRPKNGAAFTVNISVYPGGAESESGPEIVIPADD
jgi:DNA-binding transcriptional ArsR family regulator